MATREENLKKINEELEKLDDEQLEQIAGGQMILSVADSNLAHEPDPKMNPNIVVRMTKNMAIL